MSYDTKFVLVLVGGAAIVLLGALYVVELSSSDGSAEKGIAGAPDSRLDSNRGDSGLTSDSQRTQTVATPAPPPDPVRRSQPDASSSDTVADRHPQDSTAVGSTDALPRFGWDREFPVSQTGSERQSATDTAADGLPRFGWNREFQPSQVQGTSR